MSVYKSRRKDASAQFIADARELRRMTARAVKRFPSSYRYIVTNGLLEMAREIVVNAVKGNAVYLHKDLPQGDFDLRHRYLKMAEVTADAYLEEITFAPLPSPLWMTGTASLRTRPNTRRYSTASRPRATPS